MLAVQQAALSVAQLPCREPLLNGLSSRVSRVYGSGLRVWAKWNVVEALGCKD